MRGEDGVAGVRERLLQRAAAGLAVRVLELDALELASSLHRELRARLDLAGLERPGERDDLERRAGRLGGRERDAGQPEHLARRRGAARRCRRSARPAPRPPRAGCRGRSPPARRAVARLGARDHARAGAQDPARAAGQPLVELALEAVEADRRALGHAAAGELGGALGRRRADAADDLGGQRPEVGQAVGALGQRRPVAREDRAALAQRGLARELLAGAQAGVDERRAPVDARAVLLLDDRQRGPCRAGGRRCVSPSRPAACSRRRRVARLAGAELAHRRGLGGFPVGAYEAPQAGARARLVGQQACITA